MTIAVGILSGGGIVLAADGQVGLAGDLKAMRAKIIGGGNSDHPEHGVVAVSGSGSTHYIEAVTSEIIDAFMKEPTESLGEFEARLKDTLRSFYTNHVLPFPNDQLDICLLVAAQRGADRRLWATEKNTVRPVFDCEAVGSGGMFGNVLLSEFHDPQMDAKAARLLAAYVVYQCRETVDGCGLGALIYSLPGEGTVVFSTGEEIDRMDSVFAGYSWVQKESLHYVLGHSDRKARSRIANNIGALRKAASEVWRPSTE